MAELSVPVRQRGAVVRVLVRMPGAAQEFGPFPAYLDTGASVTVLDPVVIHALGAEPVAAAGLHVLGRDTVSHHGVYAVEVALADAAPDERVWFALDALDGPVNPKGTAAALGRDFLARFVLTYDGPAGRVRLRW
jgi:hypothetical protein